MRNCLNDVEKRREIPTMDEREIKGFRLILWFPDNDPPTKGYIEDKLRAGWLYGCDPGFLTRQSTYTIHDKRPYPAIEIEGFVGASGSTSAKAGYEAQPARDTRENILGIMKRLKDVLPKARLRLWSMEGYQARAIQEEHEISLLPASPSSDATGSLGASPIGTGAATVLVPTVD
jgi:hypothetical protein